MFSDFLNIIKKKGPKPPYIITLPDFLFDQYPRGLACLYSKANSSH